jgi:hypothetical protein
MTSVVGEASVWGPKTKLTGSVLLLDRPQHERPLEPGIRAETYVNFAGECGESQATSYLQSLPACKAVKERYDPFNVLRFILNVAPTNGDIPEYSIPGTGPEPPSPT